MLCLNGFLKPAFQTGVSGNQLGLGSDFHPVYEGFDPERLVGILARHRIAIGLKLHHGKAVGFPRHDSATFGHALWQGQQMRLFDL